MEIVSEWKFYLFMIEESVDLNKTYGHHYGGKDGVDVPFSHELKEHLEESSSERGFKSLLAIFSFLVFVFVCF